DAIDLTATTDTAIVLNTGLIDGNVTLSSFDDKAINTGVVTGSLYLGGGDDRLDTREGIVLTSINGDDGNDTILGSATEEAICGGNGTDQLKGFAGDDQIQAQNGNDTLEGGAGGDYLAGGSGFDTASYRGSSGGVTADLTDSGNNTGDATDDI